MYVQTCTVPGLPPCPAIRAHCYEICEKGNARKREGRAARAPRSQKTKTGLDPKGQRPPTGPAAWNLLRMQAPASSVRPEAALAGGLSWSLPGNPPEHHSHAPVHKPGSLNLHSQHQNRGGGSTSPRCGRPGAEVGGGTQAGNGTPSLL